MLLLLDQLTHLLLDPPAPLASLWSNKLSLSDPVLRTNERSITSAVLAKCSITSAILAKRAAFPTSTSAAPANSPTLLGCQMTPEQPSQMILDSLDRVADPTLICNVTTPQGMARTDLLINQDVCRLCLNNHFKDCPALLGSGRRLFPTGGNKERECGALGIDPRGFDNSIGTPVC
jgi:hypothetical protein